MIVDELIALGRTSEPAIPASLRDQSGSRLFAEPFWQALGDSLPQESLSDLIRGLVLHSRALGFSPGGSVAPVICLYRSFVRRFPEDEPGLTAWVVANRVNSHEPFGSTIGNKASSLKEHLLLRLSHASAGEKRRQRKEREEQEAMALRRARDAEAATTRLANAVRRGDLGAVQALLAKGADPSKALPAGQSLLTLAVEHGRTAVADFLRERGIQ